MWTANAGAPHVNINGKPAHRMNDAQQFCGGSGKLIQGSATVIVGDGGGGGGGGSGSGGSGSAAGGSTSAGTAGQSSTYGGPGSSSGSAGSGANQSQNPANANNAAPGNNPNQPPQKAQAQWKTVWDDDQSSVGGLKSVYEGGGTSKELDGGSQTVPGLDQNGPYSVTLQGTVTVSGKVTDSDGKGVAGAKVHVERAFGPAVDVETDSSGAWKAEGFVKDEPFHAHIVKVTVKAEGTLVDENNAPMAGVQAVLRGDAGTEVKFTSDAQGKYSVEGLLPNEGYHIEVINTGPRRR